MSTTLLEARPQGVAAGLKRLVRDTVRGLRGHDLPLHAAGATFYAGIAIVPSAIVVVWVVSLALGDARVDAYADDLAAALPDQLGAPAVARGLLEAATRMTALTALLAVLPATFYGEGLRRAFAAIAEERETMPGWRGRLRVLPLLAASPLLALLVLAVTPLVADLMGSGGTWRTLLAFYVSFLVDWLALSRMLAYVYRFLAPRPVSGRAALWGGYVTGSVVAGFVQGFVLFLSLPLDLGAPFGGFRGVGAVVAVGLWLWLLHLLALVGYELTLRIDARGAVPWALPARP